VLWMGIDSEVCCAGYTPYREGSVCAGCGVGKEVFCDVYCTFLFIPFLFTIIIDRFRSSGYK